VLGYQATKLMVKRILNIGTVQHLLPVLLGHNKTRVVQLAELDAH